MQQLLEQRHAQVVDHGEGNLGEQHLAGHLAQAAHHSRAQHGQWNEKGGTGGACIPVIDQGAEEVDEIGLRAAAHQETQHRYGEQHPIGAHVAKQALVGGPVPASLARHARPHGSS